MSALRDDLVDGLVAELWCDPTLASRNRHFGVLQGPLARRALRAYRLLRSLRREILVAERVRVHTVGGMASVVVEHPELRARRRASLSTRLLELLTQDPDLRAIFERSGDG